MGLVFARDEARGASTQRGWLGRQGELPRQTEVVV